MKHIYILLAIGLLILSSCDATKNKELGGETNTGNTNTTIPTNTENNMPAYIAPEIQNEDVIASIKTNKGIIKIKLFTDKTPITTTNFIGLSQKGYYKDVTFHRVIPGFMIQGGDPDGTGQGGESIYGKEFQDEFHPELSNIRGTISMANRGAGTNGSQFFISVADNSAGLDNKHSVFGQVVEGMDVVDTISKAKTIEGDAQAQNKPEKEIKMIEVNIEQYKDGKFVPYAFDLDAELKNMEEKEAARIEANKTRAVVETDTVLVHYKGTLEDESVFDNSYDRGEPIEVSLAAGQVIPGFGKALIGMKMGEKKSVTIPTAEAYGEYDVTRTQDVPKEQLESQGITAVEGETIPSMMGALKVLKVTEDTVTVDVNHPLAGKTLNFDLELVDFKD